MNWQRLIGLDNLKREYAYADDAVLGYTSAKRVADKWVKTTCGYCSVGCGMEVGVRDGKAVAVRGWEDHPVNFGKLCPKGLSEHHMLTSPNRALYPLLEGKRVSWNSALEAMLAKFSDVQKKSGPDALGIISTGQLLTEEFYALGKLARLGFRTGSYCGNTTLCMASAAYGYKRSFGSDGPPGAYEDLREADFILLIGANIADNHPILCQHVEANRGKYMVVVDPRVTKTAMLAELHLAIKPRSDIALLNGIANVLIQHGLVNREYVDAHTNGFESLRAFVAAYTPAHVSKLTGLAEETIVDVAKRYGQAKASLIAWTMGVNHSTQGAETVNAINNLALLTGHIGRKGASPFSITGQCNAMGTREAGGTSSLPGYRKFESVADREDLARLWNVPLERVPSARGLAYPDIVDAAAEGKIKALWIIGTNPVVSYPHQEQLRRAFRNLEFLVVQDGFHPTPTGDCANLMLPAAIWGEKQGTYTNSERRVGKANVAVSPPGEALPDFDIFLRVAEALGCAGEIYPGWSTARDGFDEWRRVSAGRLCDYSGITYELLEEHGGVQWPYTGDRDPAAVSRLYEDGRYKTGDERAQLYCIPCEPFPDQPDEKFPFVLNTGRTVEHWHTRTKTGQIGVLEHMAPNSWLEMNPVDARRLGFKAHEHVTLVSRRGTVERVELRVTEVTAPGMVFMPFHYFETNVNEVTQDACDPISREPNFKQCAVRVERFSDSKRKTHAT